MPLLPQTRLLEEPTSYKIASTPATSNQSDSHREDYLSQNTKKIPRRRPRVAVYPSTEERSLPKAAAELGRTVRNLDKDK
ncbi:hypothetical protein GEV33_004252 [Tenebrio molitor]|uniref:Uncharacterized protein n=1 Tax=Tenebrio molitor TaxID=7067 RepID=A0A8J6HPV3_TENMO|nr:hypothetical protein GEV33_004252 [Tenebrio molitor]